jgi:hypothetical protein
MDLRETDGVFWSRLSWLRIGTGGGSCEHGDEPSGPGATELIGWLVCYLLNRVSRTRVLCYVPTKTTADISALLIA